MDMRGGKGTESAAGREKLGGSAGETVYGWSLTPHTLKYLATSLICTF